MMLIVAAWLLSGVVIVALYARLMNVVDPR